jgi:nitronate monooxygenase
MTNQDFLERLGIKIPIIQAPMGGGLTTPELVAAVCNAGGLGSLAAAYLKPDQILDEVRRIRVLTDKPLNINLFAGGYETEAVPDTRPILSLLGEIHETLGLPAPVLPPLPPDPFPSQLEAVLDARPAIFSFTFGIPSSDAMNRLAERGILAIGTATTVAEARLLEKAGVAAVVAQGAEAGAHRGTFLGSFESSMIPILDLVRAIRSAVSVPVIASGGLMDGRDIAHTFTLGASAAQLGTAFLTCPESGTPEAYRQAILSARTDTTVITRAFSGRPARGLRNTFIEKLQGKEDLILPFPLQNALTRPMRAAAAKADDAGFLSLWAGQGVTRARSLPAAKLVECLLAEMKEAGFLFSET